MKLPATSFVLPCLNEASALPGVFKAIKSVEGSFGSLEVLLVDNGCDDGSAELARSFGARVVTCVERGYGASVRAGVLAATHSFVVMADSDGTYDWSEAPLLARELLPSEGVLVVGNRLIGRSEPGAMPFLHRWLGTPALSCLLTVVHGRRRGVRVGDCNGGLRAFRKEDFIRWGPRSRGMEFASEMIVRAIRANAKYVEVPVSYRRAQPGRRSHLRPLSDSLRHLMTIAAVPSLTRPSEEVARF